MTTPTRPKPIEIGPLRASPMDRCREERGVVRWYWRARRKGVRDLVWSGWATREQAQVILADKVTRGLPAPASNIARGPVATVGELLDRWMARQRERADLAPKTVDHYDKAARHLVAWVREVDVGQLDRDTVERYRDHRLRERASPRLIAQELRVWSMAWRWASQGAMVPARAFPTVPVKIDGFVLNHHTPDPAEVRKVIDACMGETRLAIELLAITGARVSEVANLRRCDIEVDGKRVHLRLSGKTGTRRFPLPEPIAETMRLRAGSEATSAFPSFGSPKDQALRSRLARACKRAKVKAFTPHGLRRMVVDRMLRAGVDPATAASLTGHSVVVMLRFYRQVTEADREAAVAKAALATFL
jgi:integrase